MHQTGFEVSPKIEQKGRGSRKYASKWLSNVSGNGPKGDRPESQKGSGDTKWPQRLSEGSVWGLLQALFEGVQKVTFWLISGGHQTGFEMSPKIEQKGRESREYASNWL